MKMKRRGRRGGGGETVDVQEEEGGSDIQTDVRKIRKGRGEKMVLLREGAERERGRIPEL